MSEQTRSEVIPVGRGRERTRRCRRAPGRWLVAAAALLAGVGAGAEVTLDTRVQRVMQAGGAESLEDVKRVVPGDVLRYTITFKNTSAQDVSAGSVVITNPLPQGTEYLAGTARGEDTRITFSVDGEHFADPASLTVDGAAAAPADYRSIRWTFEPMLPSGVSGQVSFDVRMR
ncbi:MAG: hypothetical protein PVH91_06160 [Pseudomonadales bacterium]|jgi:uncharacterized repeat protein (TIGR01451 family)